MVQLIYSNGSNVVCKELGLRLYLLNCQYFQIVNEHTKHHDCRKLKSISQVVNNCRGHVYAGDMELIHQLSLDSTEQQ